MFNWLREFLELRYEFKRCQSCEVLKQQLAIANIEKDKLLNKLLEKPQEKPEIIRTEEELKVITPHIPWNVRRQMLETEDRKRAELMKKAPKPKSIDELEETLGIDNATGTTKRNS